MNWKAQSIVKKVQLVMAQNHKDVAIQRSFLQQKADLATYFHYSWLVHQT